MTVICDLQWHNMTLSTDRLTTTTTDKSDQEGGGRCPVVPLDVQLGLWGLFHFVEAGHEGRVPGDDEGREVQRLQLYSETFSDRLQEEEEEEKEQKWAGTILHVVSFIWPVTISLQSTRPVTPAACSQLTDWLTDQIYPPADVWAVSSSSQYFTRNLAVRQSVDDILQFSALSRGVSAWCGLAWCQNIIFAPPHQDWIIWFSLEYCKMSDVEAVCQTWRLRQDSAGMLINS